MKTLVIYGSPQKNSYTKKLLDKTLKNIEGEIKFLDCYNSKIVPCKDCKYCFHQSGCSINDDMTEIYDYIYDCDAVVIATPMHFGIPSAPVVTFFSRLQPYWSNEFIRKNEEDKPKRKKAILLATTGADWPNIELMMDGVSAVAFNHMNADFIGSIYAKDTENKAIDGNEEIENKIEIFTEALNKK
ncbi:MAG: flavodoxin family protein [Firmicutes bacterium]|nr:flavodoxin family protein [Bacillota bacterium]